MFALRSYCAAHRPRQKISRDVLMGENNKTPTCCICLEDIDPSDNLATLLPPCCKKTGIHRDCVQNHALHFGYSFRCPICCNKDYFRLAMMFFGIYVPDKDVSWEPVPNAFQEFPDQRNSCAARTCVCPQGVYHVVVGTRWDLVLCRYCRARHMHVRCGMQKTSNTEQVCDNCRLMLQRLQVDNDEVPQPSTATRRRKYRKRSGGSRKRKHCKRSVCSSSSHPHPPPPSQNPIMPKAGPVTMTDVSLSPPTPVEVTEINDVVGEVLVISSDDDDDDEVLEISSDDDDDDEVLENFCDDDDDAPGKTFTSSECRMNTSCDGRAIPVNQIATTIAATEDRQNFWADLNVMSPGHGQKVKKSVASNSSIFNISGADMRSSSTSLNHSVEGSSFRMSVHSSASCSHSEPSVSGTASGSLLKSHLTSKNPQLGSAYRDQVPRVVQQTGNKVICFIFFVGHLLKHG